MGRIERKLLNILSFQGCPWENGNTYGLHGRSTLLHILKTANENGWYLVSSLDVSAKYVSRDNAPDYPIDVHSWYFMNIPGQHGIPPSAPPDPDPAPMGFPAAPMGFPDSPMGFPDAPMGFTDCHGSPPSAPPAPAPMGISDCPPTYFEATC
jgi:hypothetical protein